MTRNAEYAKALAAKLNPLPSVMLAAVGKAAYHAALSSTKQDSGEAAFNWRMNINNAQVRPFLNQRGRPPVGSTGDKRSAGFERMIVIDHRYNDFLGRLSGKDLKFLYMYNPIEDPKHSRNALIEQALAIASGQDWLEDVAKRSIHAVL
jgi:hypothetical protein